jgi:SEC-C motif-containing protein
LRTLPGSQQQSQNRQTTDAFPLQRLCTGGHGDYLLETWYPGSAGALTAESLSAKTFNWQGLTILDFRHKGDEGMVKFEAQYLDDEGKPELLQEVSRFIRVSGLWLYLDSE